MYTPYRTTFTIETLTIIMSAEYLTVTFIQFKNKQKI